MIAWSVPRARQSSEIDSSLRRSARIWYRTMSLMELVHSKRAEIERLAAKHGAGNVRVFGSVLHGQERSASDIDFLIDVVGRTSAWFPSGLALELQDLLGRPVDVVTERSLHTALRDRVLKEARPL